MRVNDKVMTAKVQATPEPELFAGYEFYYILLASDPAGASVFCSEEM
jgi:hypothetical protein